MDRNRSRAIAVVVGLSAALAGCGGASPAQTGPPGQSGPPTKVGPIAQILKVSLGTVNGSGDDDQSFAASAKTLSSGAIDVAIADRLHTGDLASEAELIADVAAGKPQLGLIAARGFDTAGVTSFVGLQAPMLIDSYDLESKVLATEWATKLLDGPRSIGVVGLGYVQGELRQALGITRDLVQASDFHGARIGIRPSRATEMTMQALGVTTVPQAADFVLSGLDGIEMGAQGIAGNGFYKGATSLTGNLVLWPRPNIVFANAKWFDGLSADQRAQLRAAVAQTSQLAVTRLPGLAQEARGGFCAADFPIKSASSPQLVALRQQLQPVIDQMSTDPGTKATIDGITALKASSFEPYVIAPCGTAASEPSPWIGPTALDGTWKMTDTRDELASSPSLDDIGSLNDGNWGDFTLRFGNGTFSGTQTNPIESSSGSGTFRVDADTVTMVQDNGETFEYRWSIYKDTLTFKRDPTLPYAAPTPMLVKPWTLVR
jgi:TRAP-type C4-dicarboxylate transport system substrate-binding protein